MATMAGVQGKGAVGLPLRTVAAQRRTVAPRRHEFATMPSA